MFDFLKRKKSVKELVSQEDMDALIKRLLHATDEQIDEVATGIAQTIIYPRSGDVDEGRRRLALVSDTDGERITNVMFALLDNDGYSWYFRDAVNYIVRHDKAAELLEHINRDRQEYWQKAQRADIFSAPLFLDWIIRSDNLPVLFDRMERGEFWYYESTAILSSLLSLTVLDRVVAPAANAASGVTGDAGLALQILKRATNENDWRKENDSVEPFTWRFDLPLCETRCMNEAVADLLSDKCPEKTICEALAECSSYTSIDILCSVLSRIGTEKSLAVLDTVPTNISANQPGFVLNTESPIACAKTAIQERLSSDRK
jgi:hypothetical protein